MKKYSFKAIAALFLVVIMCLSFIPAAFAAHEHELTKVDGQAATCEEDGWNDCWYCSTCEKYYAGTEDDTEIGDAAALTTWKTGDGKITALGHDFSGEVDKSKSDANGHYYKCVHDGCTATGSGTTPNKPEAHAFINHVCSVCNYVEPLFDVKFDGDNDKITNKDTTVDAGEENYSVTIEPKDGYTAKITKVSMGGAVLPEEEPAVNPNPPKINYRLSDDGKTIEFKVPITGDVEITFEAKAKEYDVTFELAGGSWPAGYLQKTTKHTYGTPTQIIDEDPTKAGYTFLGWKVNSNTEPEKTTIPADTAPGDVKLTAAWEEKTTNLTVVNGKPNTATIKTDEQLQITADDIDGKKFVKWTLTAPTGDAASHVKIASPTAKTTNVSVDATLTDAGIAVTITAEYNATVTYSYLNYDNTPGTLVDPVSYAKGDKVTLIYCPTAPNGKAFKCWELGGTTYEAGEEYPMGEDGVTFTAVYVDKTFEVTPAYLEFYAYEGDTKAPAFQSVSIKNIGDSSVTVTLPTSTDKYIVRDTATQPITFNTVTIPAGETYKIKVRPADPADKYKEDDSFIDYLTIANDAGQKEKVGILFEVTKPLKVRINPETLEKNCGESASFTANPTGGAGGYSYQWQVKLPGKDSYTDLYDNQKLCTASTSDCACVVSGANSRTLTLNYAVCKVDGYKFRCVVEDADGNTVTSGGASLRVKIRGQKEYDKYNYQCTHCGEISPKIKTGDESMPILWASLAGVSFIALAVGAVYYFRKKKKNT